MHTLSLSLQLCCSLDLADEKFLSKLPTRRVWPPPFPILLTAHSTPRFEFNATRPRLRLAISSSSLSLGLSLPNEPSTRGRALVDVSAEYINVAINSRLSRFQPTRYDCSQFCFPVSLPLSLSLSLSLSSSRSYYSINKNEQTLPEKDCKNFLNFAREIKSQIDGLKINFVLKIKNWIKNKEYMLLHEMTKVKKKERKKIEY